ncbi:hypothetical protein BIW11_04001 [Tropilaelaps mercedesae]|uniref:Uncharacterized protein n=1 Tax=Tropilaelaps mercedesae TaxID=418985 RepID=A0A1V9XCM8_9ACAR|nr:hypothetical protein BIW11_04001 [Tropilaelaps mercedesae]
MREGVVECGRGPDASVGPSLVGRAASSRRCVQPQATKLLQGLLSRTKRRSQRSRHRRRYEAQRMNFYYDISNSCNQQPNSNGALLAVCLSVYKHLIGISWYPLGCKTRSAIRALRQLSAPIDSQSYRSLSQYRPKLSAKLEPCCIAADRDATLLYAHLTRVVNISCSMRPFATRQLLAGIGVGLFPRIRSPLGNSGIATVL